MNSILFNQRTDGMYEKVVHLTVKIRMDFNHELKSEIQAINTTTWQERAYQEVQTAASAAGQRVTDYRMHARYLLIYWRRSATRAFHTKDLKMPPRTVSSLQV
jgi:hypothetical protein